MTDSYKLLTLGLQKGFGGDTNIQDGDRAGFAIKISHYQDPDSGGTYHDEWLPHRLGGGQELTQVGEQRSTRLYAGGTVSPALLSELGITEDEVMQFLMKMIQQLGGKTRLAADCPPVTDGHWQYHYKLKEQLAELPLTVGKEEIKYKDRVVFVHWFLITEVND